MQRKLGWKPELWDGRNFLYREHFDVPRLLPSKVDNAAYRSPIEDQGAIGSCTGHGWSSAIEQIYQVRGLPFVHLSRLGMYQFNLMIDGMFGVDAGSYISSGAKAMQKYGIPSESLWPYDISKLRTKPPARVMRDALLRSGEKAGKYYSVLTLEEMKAAIAEHRPIVIGFVVYESFYAPDVERTGLVPMPKTRSERMLGGHCVTLDSYDDAKGIFWGPNSWGTGWGDNGLISFPYEFIADSRLASDFKTIELP